MANPTSNFNWQMPTNTDLVKDLPADFEVFGQAVDTSLADLKGGTSGQILSKNSNTDMDFVWIANDQGDITGITATSPLTGGGTSGAITVGIQTASTAQLGAVQLTDSISSTSTTTAATPNSVKSAYDLAGGAIAKSLIDAEGDLIVGDAADAVQRLAIGSNGNVLTVDTSVDGKIKWAAPAGAGKVLQVIQGETSTKTTVASTTYTDTTLTATITPSSASSKILVLVSQALFIQRAATDTEAHTRLVRDATTIYENDFLYLAYSGSITEIYRAANYPMNYLDSPNTTSAITYKTQIKVFTTANSSQIIAQDRSPSTIILMEIGA